MEGRRGWGEEGGGIFSNGNVELRHLSVHRFDFVLRFFFSVPFFFLLYILFFSFLFLFIFYFVHFRLWSTKYQNRTEFRDYSMDRLVVAR